MISYSKLTKADCKIPMTMEESRRVHVEMLDEIVSFCDQHGLRYFLSGGTLLGAIRHHGFIPWDDDVDINMPRPDYNRLFQLAGGKLGDYRLSGPDNGEFLNSCNWSRLYNDDTVIENYRRGLAKDDPWYHPIFVDIFPIEGLPEGKYKCYLYWARIYVLAVMRRVSTLQHLEALSLKGHLAHFIVFIPAKLLGYNRLGKIFEKRAQKYDFENQKFVGVVTTVQYLSKEKVEKDKYLKTVKVTFEGKKYNAPGNYDTYLTQLYGDYMKMPPIEKQKSDHVFNMYWRTKQ